MRACAFECSSYFSLFLTVSKGPHVFDYIKVREFNIFGLRSNNGGTGCVKFTGSDDGAGS